jgi:hypothetical protein
MMAFDPDRYLSETPATAAELEEFNPDAYLSGMPGEDVIAQLPGYVPEYKKPEAERTLGERITGGIEAAGSTIFGGAAGLAGQMLGTAEGVGREIVSGRFGEGIAERTADERTQQFTEPFTPQTEAGREYSQSVGEALEPLSYVVGATPLAQSSAIASRVPQAAQAVRAAMTKLRPGSGLPALIDPNTGLPTKSFEGALKSRGMDFGAIINDVNQLPPPSPGQSLVAYVDDIVKNQIRERRNTGALYKYRLKGNRLINDDLAESAVTQGFREGDVTSAKHGNSQTRKVMRQMLSNKRAIQSDSSLAMRSRPSDLVGSEAMKRFNHIKEKADGLREKLNTIAEKEFATDPRALSGPDVGTGLKSLQIDTSRVRGKFFNELDRLGVDFDQDQPGKLNFANSIISEDKTSQGIIKKMSRILSKPGAANAANAHKVKRQIDTMLDFTKKSKGLTDAGKNFAKSVRYEINEAIRDVSPRYAQINDELSKAIRTMEDFDGALKSVSPAMANSEAAIGQTLRRLLSNAQSRTELANALSKVESTAKSMGGDFKTEIDRLITFNNTLDSRFGETAKGSMQGILETVADKGVISGPLSKAKDVIKQRIINDTKAFNTMERLLRREEF